MSHRTDGHVNRHAAERPLEHVARAHWNTAAAASQDRQVQLQANACAVTGERPFIIYTRPGQARARDIRQQALKTFEHGAAQARYEVLARQPHGAWSDIERADAGANQQSQE